MTHCAKKRRNGYTEFWRGTLNLHNVWSIMTRRVLISFFLLLAPCSILNHFPAHKSSQSSRTWNVLSSVHFGSSVTEHKVESSRILNSQLRSELPLCPIWIELNLNLHFRSELSRQAKTHRESKWYFSCSLFLTACLQVASKELMGLQQNNVFLASQLANAPQSELYSGWLHWPSVDEGFNSLLGILPRSMRWENLLANGACAHYVMVSKFQWKPFWLATQRDPQNDWTATQNGVNYDVFTQAPLGMVWIASEEERWETEESGDKPWCPSFLAGHSVFVDSFTSLRM